VLTDRVLDASALLALLQGEPGADLVMNALGHLTMSTANLSEVAAKITTDGIDAGPLVDDVRGMGIRITPVTEDDVRLQARIRAVELESGPPVLSLGDRLCLALAMRLQQPALTADRLWGERPLPVEVELIR
jgi:ribonuclease VapC